jgi:hypothetical protein
MKFDVVVGNPPFQPPKKKSGDGPSGDNGLYLKFIEKSLTLLTDTGWIGMVNPPAGLIKTTVNGSHTETLTKILNRGSLVKLNLDAKQHFADVGSQICYWVMSVSDTQNKVELISDDTSHLIDVKEMCYIPPKFNKIEHGLFMKIMNSKDGELLDVSRGVKNRDYTMTRLGYPKIKKGGDQILGFDEKHAKFMLSQLGLWLINYISRHDAFIYHKVLTGIKIPKQGFKLTKAEQKMLDSKEWRNNPLKERK